MRKMLFATAATAGLAIGAEVLGQVAVELGEREAAQAAVAVESRYGEGGEQQRVELERAVVALGGERGAHVTRLGGDALPQRRVQRGRGTKPCHA